MTRFGYVMVTYFSLMAIAIGSCVSLPVKLLWNASASVPIGFYDLERPSPLQVGDLVAVMPDMPLADFMVGRGYIGRVEPRCSSTSPRCRGRKSAAPATP